MAQDRGNNNSEKETTFALIVQKLPDNKLNISLRYGSDVSKAETILILKSIYQYLEGEYIDDIQINAFDK